LANIGVEKMDSPYWVRRREEEQREKEGLGKKAKEDKDE